MVSRCSAGGRYTQALNRSRRKCEPRAAGGESASTRLGRISLSGNNAVLLQVDASAARQDSQRLLQNDEMVVRLGLASSPSFWFLGLDQK